MSMISNNFEKLGFEIIQKRFDNKTDLNDISDLSSTFNPDKKIVNTFKEGLLDSSKSVRAILWNSITLVSTIITSE